MVSTPIGLAVGGDTTNIGSTRQRYLALFSDGLPATWGHAAHSTASVSAVTYVVGPTKAVKRTFTIHLAGGVSGVADDVTVKTKLVGTGSGCALSKHKTATFDSGSTWKVTYSVGPKALNNHCGRATFRVDWNDRNAVTSGTDRSTVDLLRATRLVQANAGPEPIAKGGTVTTRATLQRASWTGGHYHAYPSQDVRLQFRTTGGDYATVKVVRTGAGGVARAGAGQQSAGCWRYAYAGSSTAAVSHSAGDCVALK
jgi:hypothetical protein